MTEEEFNLRLKTNHTLIYNYCVNSGSKSISVFNVAFFITQTTKDFNYLIGTKLTVTARTNVIRYIEKNEQLILFRLL